MGANSTKPQRALGAGDSPAPSADEWVEEPWCGHTVEHRTAAAKEEAVAVPDGRDRSGARCAARDKPARERPTACDVTSVCKLMAKIHGQTHQKQAWTRGAD